MPTKMPIIEPKYDQIRRIDAVSCRTDVLALVILNHNFSTNDLAPLKPSRLERRVGSLMVSIALVVADERIGILLVVEVAQGVVHTAVNCLIGTNVKDQIPHGPFSLGHLPVRDSKIGNLEVRIRPLGKIALFNLPDTSSIGVDRFLLEVANETVCNSWRDQVAQEHGVEEDTLRPENHRLHEPAWLAHLHKGEKMHSFIV